MTEPVRPELRAQGSGVEGHSYDTDDLIGDFDIYEALVNPHDESGTGSKKGGPGGPGMMPMGQGGGAGGASSAAVAGRPMSGTAAKGTSAAGAGGAAGMGAGGFGSAGSADAGLGSGGIGASGIGASGLGGLGGVGGLGGRIPAGGSSWSPSSFGTSAAGMDPVDPTTIPPYGTPTIPGGSAPSIPTPGSSGIPTIPSTPGGSSIPSPGATSPSAPTLKPPTMPGGGGGAVPSAGGAGGAGSPSTGAMGNQAVQASPEMLRKEAQAWDQIAQDMSSGVTDQVAPLAPSAVDFGMVKDAYPSYNDVLDRVKAWAASAGAEFGAISNALNAAAVGYAETDATNTSAAKTITV